MRLHSRAPLLAAVAVLLTFGAGVAAPLPPRAGHDGAAARPARDTSSCTFEFERADNMWAATGNLGRETLTLPATKYKGFITDWAYEKRRNDGATYYGSHLRLAVNTGTRKVALYFRDQLGGLGPEFLMPGASRAYRLDLRGVDCP